MSFNSYFFIFLFLPICVLGYFLLGKLNNKKIAKIYLILMSLWFYGYFNPWYLFIILFSILFNYLFSRLILKHTPGKVKKGLAVFAVLCNLALIFYFKYCDFFLSTINSLFKKDIPLTHVLLPLGISFFTFQQISFIIDSYRQETADYTFLDYSLFVTFFPQLVAGPIVLHEEMIPQFADPEKSKWNMTNFNRGLYLFSVGLCKKVILADTFGVAVGFGWDALETLTSLEAIVVSLAYTFQIYFDFSGYSDMAMGLASMFNIYLPMNFNSPYRATSILDFWSGWHMTLTRFLRKYIYFPLGGSKKGTLRTYVNILIVFLVSGIWHGSGYTFIVWGLLHGLFQCFTRMFKKYWDKLGKVIGYLITFAFVNITWVIFKADTLTNAYIMIRKILKPVDMTMKNIPILESFRLIEFSYIENKLPFIGRITSMIPGFYQWAFLLAGFIITLTGTCVQRECFLSSDAKPSFHASAMKAVKASICLFWAIISLTGLTTFLYFNF